MGVGVSESLVVEEGRDGDFFLVWVVDGDTGARVGEYRDPIVTIPTADVDGWDYLTAEWVARQDKRHEGEPGQVFVWESAAQAKACLARIKAAWKQAKDGPMQGWMQLAIEAGWRPPGRSSR
jgi:hypothetical protein